MPLAPRAGLAAVVLTLTGAARPSPALRHVTIEAHDYSYVVPATAPAGPTVFHFVNRGHVPHEVQLFRFNANIDDSTARAYLASGNVPDSVADMSGGVLIAAPGQTTREALYAELRTGEQYALMCQFRDGAGKPQHAMLGMVALVTVR
jgi:hypothetical protein